MSKIVLFALVVLLATTLISAERRQYGYNKDEIKTGCAKHGDPCVTSDDCQSSCRKDELVCNRYAKKCQVNITPEMLQEQKKKLKHVKQEDKNYRD